MNVNLVIFKSDGSKKEIAVRPGRYVIGRKPDASIRVPSPSVSREHCELILDQGGLRVRDLGSSNGTFKNRERVKECALIAGDFVTVGPVNIAVQIDGKPAKVAPPPASDSDESDFDLPTPTAAAPSAAAASKAPAPTAMDDSGLGETIPRKPDFAPLTSKQNDDSSIFDFDFDFEDEDRPRL